MKIGTIGTGFIVDTFLDAVKKNDGVEVKCMYTRNRDSAIELATKYGIQTIYTNIEDLYNDETIDFIYVASPNSVHYKQAYQALMAGKNVICEKPFASTAKNVDTLRKLAIEKKLFLFEAITTIHLPHFKKIKELCKEISPIRIVECNFSKYSSRYDDFLAGKNPNIFNPEFSGGALADLNIYNIHFTMGAFGVPKSAIYYPNVRENGIDSSGVAIFHYDGFIASLVSAKESTAKSHGYIQGEKGSIYINDSVSGCHDVVLETNDRKETLTLHTTDNNLYYEIVEFKKIFDAQDYDTCYKLLDYSYDVYTVVENMRKDANLPYSNDN